MKEGLSDATHLWGQEDMASAVLILGYAYILYNIVSVNQSIHHPRDGRAIVVLRKCGITCGVTCHMSEGASMGTARYVNGQLKVTGKGSKVGSLFVSYIDSDV
jgi:hypothetical protein